MNIGVLIVTKTYLCFCPDHVIENINMKTIIITHALEAYTYHLNVYLRVVQGTQHVLSKIEATSNLTMGVHSHVNKRNLAV